jgi:hypothetical protein
MSVLVDDIGEGLMMGKPREHYIIALAGTLHDDMMA